MAKKRKRIIGLDADLGPVIPMVVDDVSKTKVVVDDLGEGTELNGVEESFSESDLIDVNMGSNFVFDESDCSIDLEAPETPIDLDDEVDHKPMDIEESVGVDLSDYVDE